MGELAAQFSTAIALDDHAMLREILRVDVLGFPDRDLTEKVEAMYARLVFFCGMLAYDQITLAMIIAEMEGVTPEDVWARHRQSSLLAMG